MPAIFPAHLDTGFTPGTWQENRRAHFDDFETDSGTALRSKRPGSAKTDCSFQRPYSQDDYADLIAFYKVDCAEGAVSFYMRHPVWGELETFSWAAPPAAAHHAGAVYTVSFTLIMD